MIEIAFLAAATTVSGILGMLCAAASGHESGKGESDSSVSLFFVSSTLFVAAAAACIRIGYLAGSAAIGP